MSSVGPVTVLLSSPINVDGEVVGELTFAAPILSDLCVAERYEGDMSKTAAVLARMAGVPVHAMKQVSVRDVFTIVERVSPLLCIDASAAAPGVDMPVTH